MSSSAINKSEASLGYKRPFLTITHTHTQSHYCFSRKQSKNIISSNIQCDADIIYSSFLTIQPKPLCNLSSPSSVLGLPVSEVHSHHVLVWITLSISFLEDKWGKRSLPEPPRPPPQRLHVLFQRSSGSKDPSKILTRPLSLKRITWKTLETYKIV